MSTSDVCGFPCNLLFITDVDQPDLGKLICSQKIKIEQLSCSWKRNIWVKEIWAFELLPNAMLKGRGLNVTCVWQLLKICKHIFGRITFVLRIQKHSETVKRMFRVKLSSWTPLTWWPSWFSWLSWLSWLNWLSWGATTAIGFSWRSFFYLTFFTLLAIAQCAFWVLCLPSNRTSWDIS